MLRHHGKSFFAAFVLALTVFSLLFLCLLSAFPPRTLFTASADPPQPKEASYVPGKAEALTVLFVGVQPDGAEASGFVLARFDPVQGRVPVVCFPPSTAVQNHDRMETLAEVYRYGGANYTRGILQDTLGVPIDRFVRLDALAFLSAAAAIGTIQFDLQQSVQVSQSGAEMTLQPGTQLLDGQKILDILRVQNDELHRCALTSAITAAIVNQHIDICTSPSIDGVFQEIINLVETDITYDDYDTRKRAAAFLAQMGRHPAVAITADGREDDSGKYHLADTFIAQLTQEFS